MCLDDGQVCSFACGNNHCKDKHVWFNFFQIAVDDGEA